MKTFMILFSAIFATVSSSVIPLLPISYIQLEPLPTYNRVDNTLTGEYAYNYGGGPSSKAEIKTSDGVTRGAYNYIDSFGIVQSAQYIADKDGFRIIATDIPTDAKIGVNVPLETAEVQAAKAAHFAEHAKAVAALGRKKRSLVASYGINGAVSSRYQNEEKETLKIEAPLNHHQHYLTPISTPSILAYNIPYEHQRVLPSVATSVSHQSRIQTHKSSRVEILPAVSHVIGYDYVADVPDQVISYRDQLAAPLLHPVVIQSSLPTSVSSQSRFQIHNSGEKIELEETPLIVASSSSSPVVPLDADRQTDSVIVDASAVPAITTTGVAATAVSSQSRTQIHNEATATATAAVTPFVAVDQVIDSYGHPAADLYTVAAPIYGSFHHVSQIPVDTPEVAAAKREHAQAYAAELVKHQGW